MKMILVPDSFVQDGVVRVIGAASNIRHFKPIRPRVKVEVLGGVADVTRCTPGVQVTIQDHDNEAHE